MKNKTLEKLLIKLRYNCLWIGYLFQSRFFKKKFTHVIGDSHSLSFKGITSFFVHHIGAVTAYNLNNENSTTHSKEKLQKIIKKINKKLDSVLLVFGEIDSRIHIYLQYRKNKGESTIKELIKATIGRYGLALDELSTKNVPFIVCGVPPAATQKNIYNYPFYASQKKRVEISREFNLKLLEFCRKRGYPFLDISSENQDPKGLISKRSSDDGIHLKKKVIKEAIEKLGIGFRGF